MLTRCQKSRGHRIVLLYTSKCTRMANEQTLQTTGQKSR